MITVASILSFRSSSSHCCSVASSSFSSPSCSFAVDSTDTLRNLFATYGKIVDIYLPRQHQNQTPRGFAFVRFANRADGEKALRALDGITLEDRVLTILEAKIQKEISWHPVKQSGGSGDPRDQQRWGNERDGRPRGCGGDYATPNDNGGCKGKDNKGSDNDYGRGGGAPVDYTNKKSNGNLGDDSVERDSGDKACYLNNGVEAKRIASTHNLEPTVKLDVGGHPFTTTLITLTRFPDTMLGAMFSGRHSLTKNEVGAHFIDRDGTYFREILNFLRSPESFDSSGFHGRQLTELKIEADFYGLKDLMFPVSQFVPSQPETMSTTASSTKVTITQDNEQLWYMQHSNLGDGPVPVVVCDHCGLGNPNGSHYTWGIANFTTGRKICPAQPRKTEACTQCKK